MLVLRHCSPAQHASLHFHQRQSVQTTMLERKANERLASYEHKTHTHSSDQGEGVKRASGKHKIGPTYLSPQEVSFKPKTRKSAEFPDLEKVTLA